MATLLVTRQCGSYALGPLRLSKPPSCIILDVQVTAIMDAMMQNCLPLQSLDEQISIKTMFEICCYFLLSCVVAIFGKRVFGNGLLFL